MAIGVLQVYIYFIKENQIAMITYKGALQMHIYLFED